jgi:hypothetical protein
MAMKTSSTKKVSPRTSKATGSGVAAWEDDPLSGAPPITLPAPTLSSKPYPLALAGSAPVPKTYPPGTGNFRYWNAACALRRGADFWGTRVPKNTAWQPGGTLKATLDHGQDLNAYYDRAGLWFFHATSAGKTVYSGESPDVLCHELGHAILDSIRPELWDAMSAEVAAFHESFGDMSAILSALRLPSMRAAVISETGGTLYHNSRLSRLAEQLGAAIRLIQPDAVDPDCLRNAVNSFFYRDPLTIPHSGPASHLTSEPHNFSRVFTGGFFEALSGMAATIASPATDKALYTASRDAGQLLVKAVIAAPIVPGYYAQVAAHMVEADQADFSGKYGAAIKSAFVRRGILSLTAASSLAAAKTEGGKRGIAGIVNTAAAGGGVTQISVAAADFALGAGTLQLQAAGDAPRFRVASAAPAGGPTASTTGTAAAHSFAAYLFRRGRVDLGKHGDTATRVVHANAKKTHELVGKGGELHLQRITFDCGFDWA